MSLHTASMYQTTSAAHVMRPANSPAWSPSSAAAVTRVFVVHDVSIYRRGLCAVLAGERDLDFVGEAESCTQAATSPLAQAPQVVLFSQQSEAAEMASDLQRLAAQWPQAQVVVLSAGPDQSQTRLALQAGATRVVAEDATAFDLVGEIHAAARGQRTPAPPQPSAGEAGDMGSDLTPRERELISLMAQGLSNGEISTQLKIALPTVKFHVTNILEKLDAVNRTAAVLTALRHKIVAFA